jgi:hypothetical protein
MLLLGFVGAGGKRADQRRGGVAVNERRMATRVGWANDCDCGVDCWSASRVEARMVRSRVWCDDALRQDDTNRDGRRSSGGDDAEKSDARYDYATVSLLGTLGGRWGEIDSCGNDVSRWQVDCGVLADGGWLGLARLR